MSNYTFKQIKEDILKWSQSNMTMQLSQNDYVEITKNEEEVLLIDLTFEYCLAQIVVSDPSFAPYQYVSFEAMTLESNRAQETGNPEMVYFFYDATNMLKSEVLDEVTFGIKLCSTYVPDKLQEYYLNKKGGLTINNEKLYHEMHPDDLKKYDKNLTSGDFFCIGVESQYLIVKNSQVSLRVIPDVFKVN